MSCGHYPRLHRSDHLCKHTVTRYLPDWPTANPTHTPNIVTLRQYGVTADHLHESDDDD